MPIFASLQGLVLGLVVASLLAGSAWEPGPPVRSSVSAWEAAGELPETRADDLPRAGFEDFRVPAGRMVEGVLRVTLEAKAAEWRPWGEEGPVLLAHVFAADGESPQVPAPLIRAHAGTPIHVTVRNNLSDTLVVRGLRDHGAGEPGLAAALADQVVVAPGDEAKVLFTPTVPGTYSWGGDGLGPGAQADRGLRGLFIVDPPGEEPNPEERFFLITHWGDPDRPASFLPSTRFFLNGRSWPHTERLTYTQGDTIRWRVVNFSGRPHPMHLHGFHFQVDARGDLFREQVYAPEERRLVVTEALEPAESIRMSWVASEPGNWIFHCHFMRHMSWRQTAPLEGPPLTHTHAHPDPEGAPEGEDLMGGLVLGITVAPHEDYHPDTSLPRRRLDLFVNEREGVFGTEPGYAFVLGEESSQPAADSVRFPGSLLLLRRGEPTEIVVHNRSRVPLGVHWHGLELESWTDGVPGWSGLPGKAVPAIGPGDSLAVRMAPPRAGTFMYHVHSEPEHQLAQGLYGPLLVLDEDEGWDPERDRLFLLGSLGPGDDPPPAVNGRLEPVEESFRQGESYRLRFMHISPDDGKQVALLRDGAPVTWLPVAKDGADLPESQVTGIPAQLQIFVGETYDFLWSPTEPGDYTLRVISTFDPGAPVFPRDAPAPDTMDIALAVPPRFEPGPCPFEAEPEVLEQFRCGSLTVLEDRARPDGRTLKLAVAVLSSTSDTPLPDPVVLVPGGPGDSYLRRFAGAVVSTFRADREVVVLDPRGTGFSEPSVCSDLDQERQRIRWVVDLEPEERRREELAALERCRREIEREGIDVSQYNTRTDALDLDDLRRALGYDRWNFLGSSYGALVALEGLRTTPKGIRSVVLDGPVPPDVGRSIEEQNRKFADALSRLFSLCAEEPSCDSALPDAEARFWDAIEGLDREPMVIPTGGRAGLVDG